MASLQASIIKYLAAPSDQPNQRRNGKEIKITLEIGKTFTMGTGLYLGIKLSLGLSGKLN